MSTPFLNCRFLAALGMTAACAVAEGQTIVIRAGRLLDPASGTVSTNQLVVVNDGKITRVGPGIPVRENTEVIDLTKYTVMPGMIDAHVHLAIGGPLRNNALADLRAGFTTVVDLGARSTRLLRLRDSINAGAIPGPRVLAAGMWVGTKNGICEFGGIGIEGGPDAFRARVRENVAAGADVIKVCVSGWPGDAYARPSAYEIADDALAAVVSEAHAANRKVIAHDISLGGVGAALRAGVDGLAHAAYLDSATAVQLRDRGVFMIPTLASLTAGDTSAVGRGLFSSTALAHRARLPIVFGTDGGVLPHGQNAQEFDALSRAGLSPIEAIRAATTNAARAFQLSDSLGAIRPGMIADIIAVDGAPSTDLHALSRVRFVMQRGRVVLAPE